MAENTFKWIASFCTLFIAAQMFSIFLLFDLLKADCGTRWLDPMYWNSTRLDLREAGLEFFAQNAGRRAPQSSSSDSRLSTNVSQALYESGSLSTTFSPATQTAIVAAIRLPSSKPPEATNAHSCDVKEPFRFVTYVSSPLEASWKGNIANLKLDWDNRGCPRIRSEMTQYNAWLAAAISQNATTVSENDPVISYHVYEDLCSHDGRKFHVPIEPLMGMLRHPRAICLSPDFGDVIRKDWLILPHESYFPRSRDGRTIMFDLGASLYKSGSGGASQDWFVNEYAARGLAFDHIYAWEASSLAAQDIFRDIPKKLLHKISYYNVPVEKDPNGLHNPIRVLKEAATIGDYVVVKLDIDNGPIEMSLMKQLMADDAAIKLVDELFFEQHTSGSPMIQYWGGSVIGDIVESYELFSQLRKRGIRAHSWV
jgi:hypothetical protein